MPTPLTDADKVLRNDTGKDIVSALETIADNTSWAGHTAGDLPLGNTTPVGSTAAAIGSLSDLTTTVKSSIVGAVNEVVSAKMNADKIKTYNWVSTNVAINTLYSGGSMYYCDITFPNGDATDCNEILALTMVDYGGLSNVLQFQIRGSRTFRIWSKTSMTLSTLTVKVLYFT